jgi:hypothetical protein
VRLTEYLKEKTGLLKLRHMKQKFYPREIN